MTLVPRLLVITDRRQVPKGRRLSEVIEECIGSGARDVFLRERDLDDDAYADLANLVESLVGPAGGRLIVRSALHDGEHRGVHLRSGDEDPAVRPRLLGRSVHDTAQLMAARVSGCDYVTLSPIALTASKPGHGPALGPEGFSRIRASVPDCPPALALGGVTPSNVPMLTVAGAQGIAVMGSLMRSPHPGELVRQLFTALDRTSWRMTNPVRTQ